MRGQKTKTFLHFGCGTLTKNNTTRELSKPLWNELRLDIDATVNPDFVGTMTDMGEVTSKSVDAVYSSHNIEHLYVHEVPLALSEFKRVLKNDGFLVITCPDLQEVAKLVVADKLTEPAYVSPAGPIAPIDIMFGFRESIARGNTYMAHRSGFTETVLHATLLDNGFPSVATMRRPSAFDLWAIAGPEHIPEPRLRKLAEKHFPEL